MRLNLTAASSILAVAAVLLLPGAALANGRTYVFPATGSNRDGSIPGFYKPRKIVFSQDGAFYVTNITWRGWNTHRAVGHGVAHEKNCVPSCAQAPYIELHNVGVVANRRTVVDGYWVYAGLWVQGRGSGINWATTPASIASAAAAKPVRTVRQFDRLPFGQRERFAIRYMTSHPDHVCYAGRPTPRRVAVNVKAAMAGISPAISADGGPRITPRESIGKAIRAAEAAIGC